MPKNNETLTPGQQLDAMLSDLANGAGMELEPVKRNSPTMEVVKTGACVLGAVGIALGVTYLMGKAAEAILAE